MQKRKKQKQRNLAPWAILLGIAIVIHLVCSGIGWDHRISDSFGFRQGQTAISVQWFLKNGLSLRYWTPVFGPPWTLPFEFPFFQGIVAELVRITGLSIESAGRAVSVLFFYLSVAMANVLLVSLGASRRLRFLTATLILASPIYIFWSRTFMIESTALFLALGYLAFVVKDLRRPTPAFLCVGLGFGILAALTKITTLFPFLALAGLALAERLWRQYGRRAQRRKFFETLARAGALLGLPVLFGVAWTHFADAQKQAVPFGRFITSQNLTQWNFGTLEQRLSADVWEVWFHRTVGEAAGSEWLFLVIVAIGTFVLRGKNRIWAWFALGAFVLGQLTFTNLYRVHSYYPYAVGVLALFFAASVIDAVLSRPASSTRQIGILLIVLMIPLLYRRYAFAYWATQTRPQWGPMQVAEALDRITPENSVVWIYGRDWSSEIPYYADRLAVMDRFQTSLDQPETRETEKLLAQEGRRVDAVVYCGVEPGSKVQLGEVITHFKLEPRPRWSDGQCSIFKAL